MAASVVFAAVVAVAVLLSSLCVCCYTEKDNHNTSANVSCTRCMDKAEVARDMAVPCCNRAGTFK